MKLITRKKSYLLLEIMICIALLSLCLVPLMHPYFGILKTELNDLKEVQLYHLGQNAFCEIKEMLAEHRFHWADLDASKGISGDLAPVIIRKGEAMLSISRQFTIKKISYANKNKLGKNALLLEVSIKFDHQPSFVRTIFLERHEKTSLHTV